ncbi:MAG: VWA domain-containing protein [Betaproteobacteria bacterium]|nr:MAG: VWA domain-containing protein [Betaproteobacteria bacterium]
MLIDFFLHLKNSKLPVSTREFLTLLDALEHGVVSGDIDDFYFLARTCLVKDESLYDRFNLAFGTYFNGVESVFDIRAVIPEEWIRKLIEGNLSEEDKALVKALGGWDKLMETLKQRLEEQRGRHQGGAKWIGTAGTSPFGAYGYNPEGIRIGQEGGRNRSAIKVWDERTFRNLDDSVELNTRNIKIALRRLRRFAREGVPEELDLDATIEGTAKNAGWLDLHLVPERRNRIKVLLFLDVGGSMDPHVQVCEELFSAAKSEFRHLEYFYFHNCVYDYVWRDNRRRRNERTATFDVLHKYGPDWKLIFVGDAAMSPYELVQRNAIWLNPEPERSWTYTRSTQLVLDILGPRMFPLTLDGLNRGIAALRR